MVLPLLPWASKHHHCGGGLELIDKESVLEDMAGAFLEPGAPKAGTFGSHHPTGWCRRYGNTWLYYWGEDSNFRAR
jgi:hypothetical protein